MLKKYLFVILYFAWLHNAWVIIWKKNLQKIHFEPRKKKCLLSTAIKVQYVLLKKIKTFTFITTHHINLFSCWLFSHCLCFSAMYFWTKRCIGKCNVYLFVTTCQMYHGAKKNIIGIFIDLPNLLLIFNVLDSYC